MVENLYPVKEWFVRDLLIQLNSIVYNFLHSAVVCGLERRPVH